jgi:hypothetical protein
MKGSHPWHQVSISSRPSIPTRIELVPQARSVDQTVEVAAVVVGTGQPARPSVVVEEAATEERTAHRYR